MRFKSTILKLTAPVMVSFFLSVSSFFVSSATADDWSYDMALGVNGELAAIANIYENEFVSGSGSSGGGNGGSDTKNPRNLTNYESFEVSARRSFSGLKTFGLTPGVRFTAGVGRGQLRYPERLGIIAEPVTIKSRNTVGRISGFLRTDPIWDRLSFEAGLQRTHLKTNELLEYGKNSISENRSATYTQGYMQAEFALTNNGQMTAWSAVPVVIARVSKTGDFTTGTVGLGISF